MRDSSVARLGGYSAIFVGVFYVLFAVLLLVTPQTDNSVLDHARHGVLFIASHYVAALIGLCGIAAIPAISRLVVEEHEGLVRWSSAMGYLGFAVLAINNFRQADIDARLAEVYMQATPALQETIVATWVGLVELSPTGAIDVGGVGLWVLIVSAFGLRSRAWPRPLSFVGMVGGGLLLLIVLGVSVGQRELSLFAMLTGGVILVPAWFVWMGLRLVRSTRASRQRSAA